MNARKLVGIGLVAFALAILSVVMFAQQGKTDEKADHNVHGEALRACATHCAHLLRDGKKDHLTTLMTCQDCANFCGSAAQIVSRGGPFTGLICEGCAEACSRCGKACGSFPDDTHMKQCADECRKCEQACRDMLKHIGQSK
jgi:hypothetical protein